MQRESDLMHAIMLASSDTVDWMRNNVGATNVNPRCPHCGMRPRQQYADQWIRFGVGGPGGADLIGIIRNSGRLIACEVKTQRGRLTDDQRRFGDRVTRDGALYVIARSPDDIHAALDGTHHE
jgi:hypothetical protein